MSLMPESAIAALDDEASAGARALTQERRNHHGDWDAQSALADNLMFQLTHSRNWETMGWSRRQALFNIAQKISRICTGDPEFADHWADIGGYALLGQTGQHGIVVAPPPVGEEGGQ